MGMEQNNRFTIPTVNLRRVSQADIQPREFTRLAVPHVDLRQVTQDNRTSINHFVVPSVPLNPLEQSAPVTAAVQSPATIKQFSPTQPSFLNQTLTRMYSGIQGFVSPASIQSPAPMSPLDATFNQSKSGIEESLPTFQSPATPAASIHNPTPQTVIAVVQTPQRPVTMANLGTPATPQPMPTTPSPSFELHTRKLQRQNDILADDSNYLPHDRRGGLYRAPAYYQEPVVTQAPAPVAPDISFEINNNGGLHKAPAYYYTRYDESPNRKPTTTWSDLIKHATKTVNSYTNEAISPAQRRTYNEATSPVCNLENHAMANQAPEPISPAPYMAISYAALEEKQSPVRQAQAPIQQVAPAIVRQAYITQTAATQPDVLYIRKPGIAGKVKNFMVLNPAKK
jgi:hypothetical protein